MTIVLRRCRRNGWRRNSPCPRRDLLQNLVPFLLLCGHRLQQIMRRSRDPVRPPQLGFDYADPNDQQNPDPYRCQDQPVFDGQERPLLLLAKWFQRRTFLVFIGSFQTCRTSSSFACASERIGIRTATIARRDNTSPTLSFRSRRSCRRRAKPAAVPASSRRRSEIHTRSFSRGTVVVIPARKPRCFTPGWRR